MDGNTLIHKSPPSHLEKGGETWGVRVTGRLLDTIGVYDYRAEHYPLPTVRRDRRTGFIGVPTTHSVNSTGTYEYFPVLFRFGLLASPITDDRNGTRLSPIPTWQSMIWEHVASKHRQRPMFCDYAMRDTSESLIRSGNMGKIGRIVFSGQLLIGQL